MLNVHVLATHTEVYVKQTHLHQILQKDKEMMYLDPRVSFACNSGDKRIRNMSDFFRCLGVVFLM